MLQSTPMPYKEDSADARLCQQDDLAHVWTRVEMVDPGRVIAVIARAYNDAVYPEPTITAAAILGPSRAAHVAQARHLCAYLLVEDYHLTNLGAARALGRMDHSTTINSRARIAAALPHDTALHRVLARARAALAGNRCDERIRARRDEGRCRALAEASPQEWYEYRYWRLRSLRAGALG